MIDLPIIADNLTGYAVSGSLNFNTSLEYVPALLIPKFYVHKLNNYVTSDVFREGSRDFRFKSNDWDSSKRMNKANSLQDLLRKTNLSLLYFL